jgi:hypothetical protein
MTTPKPTRSTATTVQSVPNPVGNRTRDEMEVSALAVT